MLSKRQSTEAMPDLAVAEDNRRFARRRTSKLSESGEDGSGSANLDETLESAELKKRKATSVKKEPETADEERLKKKRTEAVETVDMKTEDMVVDMKPVTRFLGEPVPDEEARQRWSNRHQKSQQMDKGKAAAQSSRVESRRVTQSAQNRKIQSELEASHSQQPHFDRHAYTSQSSRPMKDDENEVALPTPQPTRSTTSTHGTFMDSAGSMCPGDLMHRFVDSEGEAGSDDDDAGDAGGPLIGDLIPSYRYHVACQLWSGQDRGILTVHSRSSTLRTWRITDDEAAGIIQQSGLGHLVDIMFEHLDEPLLCAFVERWQPETSSFHMPFGEMSVTLHDTAFILGVPVAGETITPVCDGTPSEVLRVLGVSLGYLGRPGELKALIGWNASAVKQSAMRELADRAGCRASRKSRVYLWWVLTSTLFVDRSKTHGLASFFELLRRPAEASRYAWGAGALAHLYRDLGMTSRSECRQLGACATLFQAWIYAYFPCFRPQVRRSWTPDQPHARRWIARTLRSELADESLREYRLTLDSLTADHVDWLPFVPDPASHFPISSFSGVIHCRSITEAYMPDRVARQFGLVQGIPHAPLAPRRAIRTSNPREYKVEHDPATWVFQQGLQNNTFHNFPPADVSSDCGPDYMDWYTPRTHPRLINGPAVELLAPYGMNPYQSMQQMAGTLAPYHRDVYDGTSAADDDLRILADICEHMMPQFSIDRRDAPH